MANMKLLTFVVLPLLAAADNGGPPSQAVINCVNKKVSAAPNACGYGNSISCTHECNETLGDIQAQLDGSCCELATEWTPDYCRKKIAELSDRFQQLKDTCSTTTTTSPGVHAPPTYCVSWHVGQHAEGAVFSDRTAAESKFNQLSGGSWAEVLENGQLRVLKRYGSMGESDWQMLDDWCGKHLSSPETHAYDLANMFNPQFLPKLALAGMACVGGVLGAVTVLAVAGVRKHKVRGEPLLPHV